MGGTEFPKIFWGYDTFDYSPVKGRHYLGQKDGFYKEVKDRFKDYHQVKLIKGLLPNSFKQGIPNKLAYMHIDLNNFSA